MGGTAYGFGYDVHASCSNMCTLFSPWFVTSPSFHSVHYTQYSPTTTHTHTHTHTHTPVTILATRPANDVELAPAEPAAELKQGITGNYGSMDDFNAVTDTGKMVVTKTEQNPDGQGDCVIAPTTPLLSRHLFVCLSGASPDTQTDGGSDLLMSSIFLKVRLLVRVRVATVQSGHTHVQTSLLPTYLVLFLKVTWLYF